jgi:hypothetical protein
VASISLITASLAGTGFVGLMTHGVSDPPGPK